MNATGILMILAGVWVIAQVLRGNLLHHLGVTG